MTHLALISGTEWLIVIGAIVLLFGGRKIPELARAMGRSITEFKQGLKGDPELGDGERREGGGKKDEDKDRP